VAPKLPPKQQAMADGFFGGKAVRDVQGARVAQQMNRVAKRAMAGAYGGSPISPSVMNGGGSPGQKILRQVDGGVTRPTAPQVRQLGRG
jgi:hypothetical protein